MFLKRRNIQATTVGRLLINLCLGISYENELRENLLNSLCNTVCIKVIEEK